MDSGVSIVYRALMGECFSSYGGKSCGKQNSNSSATKISENSDVKVYLPCYLRRGCNSICDFLEHSIASVRWSNADEEELITPIIIWGLLNAD